MSPPGGLNLATERLSVKETYRVEIHPVLQPVAINKLHAWEITLRTPSGAPVENAHIDVGGGMPQHGHGFPTQPHVTKALGDGRYLVEGMKFSMPGWWEIKLKIAAAEGADDVTFNTVVALPGAVASAAAGDGASAAR
jgi:hypothetical protein